MATLEASQMDSVMASSAVSRTPELLYQIFDVAEQQSLARLARASIDFHHISISYLWSRRTVDLFRDLLGLLREDKKSEEPLHWYEQLDLGREPQGFDWNRFHHYSVYVTSLVMDNVHGAAPLVAYMGDRSHFFFPRLRDLVIQATIGQHPAEECIRLAGPGLRRLEVNGRHSFAQWVLRYDDHLTEPFFRNIMTRTPNLTEFRIVYYPLRYDLDPPRPALIDNMCLVLRSLPGLQTVEVDFGFPLPNPILSAIAAHPSISNATLDRLEDWPTMGSGSLYFPSLKMMQVACHRAAGNRFVQAIGCPHLLSKLDISFFPHEDDVSPPVFQPFSNLFQLSVNLTLLRLTLSRLPISWAQLRTIIHCPLLVTLDISNAYPITGLNDEALKELASSLSYLEDLRLITTFYNDPELIEVTLLGLASLAKLTPRLLKLNITITTRVSDPRMIDALLLFRPTSPHPLQEFSLCNSEINIDDDTPEFMGARRIAGVITSLWPLLRSNKCGWKSPRYRGEPRKAAWDAMCHYMEQRERDEKPISFL